MTRAFLVPTRSGRLILLVPEHAVCVGPNLPAHATELPPLSRSPSGRLPSDEWRLASDDVVVGGRALGAIGMFGVNEAEISDVPVLDIRGSDLTLDWDHIRRLSDLRDEPPTENSGSLSIELIDDTGIPFRGQELMVRYGHGGSDRIVLDQWGKWSVRDLARIGTCRLLLPTRLELSDEQRAVGKPDGFSRAVGDVTVTAMDPGEIALPRYNVHYRIVVTQPEHVVTRVELGATGFSAEGVLLLPRAGAGRFHPWAALTVAARHLARHPDAGLVILGHSGIEEPADHAARRADGLVHFLRDERDAWIALAGKWGRVHDVQEFFEYLRTVRRWSLPRLTISGTADEATNDATRAFQRVYNDVFAGGQPILEDGVIGVQTLGAVFDVARSDLLEWFEHGHTEIGAIVFRDPHLPSIACPPSVRPAPALASALLGQFDGRFVDLVMLSADDMARVELRAEPSGAAVYSTRRVETLPLDGTASPGKGLLQLRVITPDGRVYADAHYTLHVAADHRSGTTSRDGYISEDGLAAGIALLEVEGARVVFHDAYRTSPLEAAAYPDDGFADEDYPNAEDADEPLLGNLDGAGPNRSLDAETPDEDDEDGGDTDEDVVILDDEVDPDAPSEPEVPPEPPPLPGDPTVDVYCSEPGCPLHAEAPGRALQFLLRDGYPVPDAKSVGGSRVPCPLCRASPPLGGVLIYTPRERAAVVPVEWDAASGVWRTVVRAASALLPSASDAKPTLDPAPSRGTGAAVGVVLPLLPYGGHVLAHGNDDASRKYGPSNADPLGPLDPQTPMHVRELQRDLARLGYLDGRPKRDDGAKPGMFDDFVAGAVLALKRDLAVFYGVRTTLALADSHVSTAKPVALAGLDNAILFDGTLKNEALISLEGIRNRLAASAAKFLDLDHVLHKSKQKKRTKSADESERGGGWRTFVKSFETSRHFPAGAAKVVTSVLRSLVAVVDTVDLAEYPGERGDLSFADVVAHPAMEPARRTEKAMTAWTRDIGCMLSLSSAAARMRDEARTLASPLGASDTDLAALSSLVAELESGAARLAAFGDEFTAIIGGFPKSVAAYLARLRAIASVDRATALYIKAMTSGVPVGHGGATKRKGGTLAFRFPVGGTATEADDLGKRATLDLIFERNRSGPKVPPMYPLERFCGESGLQQFGRPLQRYGFTSAERNERHPLMGLDWNSRGGSSFSFNPFWTRGPGEGVTRSLALSRGWGIGQFTIATRLPGITPSGRSTKTLGLNWIAGLPISADNVTASVPRELGTTEGGIDVALDLLRRKFRENSLGRDCTYQNAGGKRYDCHNCLARFIPPAAADKNQKGVVKMLESVFVGAGESTTTYYYREKYDPTDPEQVASFATLMGEAPTSKDKDARREFPCSWLTAVMRYAGSGPRAIARLRKFVANVGRKTIPANKIEPLFIEYIEKVEHDGVDF